MTRHTPTPAVFLDRDDTIMAASDLPAPKPPAAPGDVFSPDLVQLLPGAAHACRTLKSAGVLLVIVTNQGSVARGAATIDDVRRTCDRLRDLLRDHAGADVIDAVYACPFHPAGNVPAFTREHPWRKPAPGMILAAARELNIDLQRSWLVGDAQRDIDAGIAAGIPADRCLRVGPAGTLPTILDAAQWILSHHTP